MQRRQSPKRNFASNSALAREETGPQLFLLSMSTAERKILPRGHPIDVPGFFTELERIFPKHI